MEVIYFFNDFTKSLYSSEGRRKFEIAIENYIFKSDYDIFKEAGGINTPIYEIFEFTYRNDVINVKNKTVIDIRENKLMLKIYFKGK